MKINSEFQVTSAVSLYLRKTKKLPKELTKPYAVEYKILKKNNLHFTNDFEPQQLPSLYQTKHSGLYYKISDEGRATKPFDAFHLKSSAYVAVYIAPELYYIDIDTIWKLQKQYKGLKKETIKKISKFNITL